MLPAAQLRTNTLGRIAAGLHLLLLIVAFGGCPNPTPSPVSDGAVDGAPNSCGDGGSGDMCSSKDPVVGQPCGPGNYCPCGYFCPSGTCQIADFHPACDLK